jgi:hypothetical protein
MLCYFNQVRRGKINERLRCLQDIVPGCYKVNKFFIFGLKKKKKKMDHYLYSKMHHEITEHGNGSNAGRDN